MHEFVGSVELRRQGVRGGDSASNARSQAVLHGLRLAALCGNIWPADDDGLSQLVSEQIITELISFSINARRFMEISGHKNLKAEGPLIRISQNGYKYENDVWTAVNRVVHADKIEVHYVTPVTRKFENLGDLVVANAMITSPQRDTVSVCPEGLFIGFCQSPQVGPANY
ncbi:hypothetical protein I5535_10280 [Rhodobacteraceae bacterium F11138]|nr:hypothetical protein [Rhodobacteraceae bacterium F11138]